MAKESFSQIAFMTVTESAANTLTFAGLSVFSNVLAQKGMLIHRVQYTVTAADYGYFNSTGDALQMGLAGSDGLASVSLQDPEVYDEARIYRIDVGAAAQGVFVEAPIIHDFNPLPGGGKLVPADRLYVYALGTGLATPSTINCRVDYTLLDMAPADYLELAQAMRVLR